MRSLKTSLIVPVLSAGLLVPVAAAAHDDVRQQQGRFDDRTYERMRRLAHELDERAQHAVHQAMDGAHHGDNRERRFINDVRHFARQAADFHRRMDRYRESPWDVPREIDHLTDDARRVERQLRNAHVFEHTWGDWAEVVDVLVQMQRSSTVDHGRVRYGDHGDGYGNRNGDRSSDRVSRRY